MWSCARDTICDEFSPASIREPRQRFTNWRGRKFQFKSRERQRVGPIGVCVCVCLSGQLASPSTQTDRAPVRPRPLYILAARNLSGMLRHFCERATPHSLSARTICQSPPVWGSLTGMFLEPSTTRQSGRVLPANLTRFVRVIYRVFLVVDFGFAGTL